ncbi:MAG: ABC transporter permease, partial [Clostridiales bacterium]|nr:ABC transporter permease [Clostridiales bacterium]
VIVGEVLGEAILGKRLNFLARLIFVVLGGVVYYLVIGLVLWLKMPTNMLKALTALIVAIFLAVPYLKAKSKDSFARAGKRGVNKNAKA